MLCGITTNDERQNYCCKTKIGLQYLDINTYLCTYSN